MKRTRSVLWTIFVLVAVLSVAVIWTRVIPQYQAKGEIRVRPTIPVLVFKTDENGAIPFYDSFVNTQVAMIQCTSVLSRVLDQNTVIETYWIKAPKRSLKDWLLDNPPVPALERLKDALSVRPRPNTEIIDVSITLPIASEAKILVDSVLDNYLSYTREASNESDDALFNELKAQAASLNNAIQGHVDICNSIRKKLGTDDPKKLISSQRSELDLVQSRVNEVQKTIAMLEFDYQALKSRASQMSMPDDNVPALSAVNTGMHTKYTEDAEWRALDRNVRTLYHNMTSHELEPDSPDMIQATKDLEFAKELLQLRESQMDQQWRTQQATVSGSATRETALNALEHDIQGNKLTENFLLTEIRKKKDEFQMMFVTAQTLEEVRATLAEKRQLYEVVRTRLEQKAMERKANIPGPIDVMSKAFVSSQPSQDRRVLYTAIVLILDGLAMILSGWLLRRRGLL